MNLLKFFHISDLHIGKRLNEIPLIDDQQYILGRILGLVDSEKPDAVLICGDVYDKPVPPAEAVRVFDDFLTALSDRSVAAIVISGNHDSPERIAFGARLLSRSGVYVSPVYDGGLAYVDLPDDFGEVRFWLMPFLKPVNVRRFYPDAPITDYSSAVREVIAQANVDFSKRNVLLCHQNVTNTTSTHADEISIGGLDNVDFDIFDGFDYVALGHIHTVASVGRAEVRFCGAPLEYSFNECGRELTVTCVELKEKGDARIKLLPLEPLHRLRRLKGSFEQVTAPDFEPCVPRDDYVHITLTDEEDIVDAVGRLRTVYPNLMQLEYDNRRTRASQSVADGCSDEDKSPLDLFGEFYFKQNNAEMSAQQLDLVRQLLEEGGAEL